MKRDGDIDLDELDELPDVVLGEKTRALRVEREGGRIHLKETETVKEDIPEEKEMPEDFQFTRSLDARRIAEELKKQEEAEKLQVEREMEKENIPVKDEAETEIIPSPMSRMARRKKKKEKTAEVNETAQQETVVIPEQKQEKKIPEVSENQAEETQDDIAVEVPASIIDDDPSVDDELAKLFIGDDESHTATNAMTSVVEQVMSETATAQTETQRDVVYEEDTQTQSQLVYEEQPIRKVKKKRRKRSALHTLIVMLLCVLLVLLGCGCYGIWSGMQPSSFNGGQVTVTVEEGESLKSVLAELEQRSVIRNDQIAYLYAKLKKHDSYTAGEHVFSTDMTLDEVFEELARTTMDDNTARVTVIEGDWAKDIAARFASVTNVSEEELLSLWNNADWIRSQMEYYPFLTEEMFADGVRIYLEGYLAPDTYEIYRDTTAEDITKKLLDQSLVVYRGYEQAIAQSGRSIHQIYTMASILQYEAGTNPDDLAKVASVFYNRLDADMTLGSSVTVCYAIDFDKQTDGWQACEMNSDFDSPYNTYMYGGLPPGAIENAGSLAIHAAINPADTDYYYFMADVCGDGTVYYATTLEEHNANVNTYLSDISNGCN